MIEYENIVVGIQKRSSRVKVACAAIASTKARARESERDTGACS